MSGLFKQNVPDAKTGPSKDDERQRAMALEAQKPKGGRGTTMLTQGMAFPALAPAGTPPPTRATTG